jgi:hypothetical protein
MTSAAALIEIERKMWTNEVAIYEATYLPDAVLIFAETGRIDLATALAALRDEGEKGERWAEVNFDDVRVLELGTDAAMLTYAATARWNYQNAPGRWLCSTAYVLRPEGWRIALHQQTTLASEASSAA